MYRLVLSDLDGTLLNSEKRIFRTNGSGSSETDGKGSHLCTGDRKAGCYGKTISESHETCQYCDRMRRRHGPERKNRRNPV